VPQSSRNQSSPRWFNWGAIAILAIALLNIFFWPGPEGIALVKIGTPEKPLQIEATLLGINTERALNVFKPGSTLRATIDKNFDATFTLAEVQELSGTVATTQRDGTVKALLDPRPEMGYSKNLLLKFKVQGYTNNNGTYVGLKPIRIGSAIKIVGDEFETAASVISVRPMDG
jgi:hypothetical protein